MRKTMHELAVAVVALLALGAVGVATSSTDVIMQRQETMDSIQDALMDQFPTHRDRGVKARGDLWVLKKTRMPAVIVECEFLSNAMGRRFLTDRENHRRIAVVICMGLVRFAQLEANP